MTGAARTYHGPPTDDPTYVPPPRGGRYQNVLLAVLFSTFGFVFFDRLMLSYLAPFFKGELGLSNAAIGLLGGVPALTWAISGMLVGYLSDRRDRRKSLLVAAIIAFTVFSAASGLVGGVASLILLRALMGAAEGAVLPLAQPLMMHSSEPRRRGLMMGLLQGSSAGLLGGIVGPLVTVWMAETWGWRTAFVATVAPGAILAVLVLVVVRDLRLRHPATLAMDAEGPEASGGPVASGADGKAADGGRGLLRHRNIVICLAVAVFYLTWFVTTQTFTPLYLADVKGFDPATMSFVMSGIGIAWVLWGAVVPGLSDRIGRRPTMIGFSVLSALSPLAIMALDTPWVLWLALIVTYTGLGCFVLFMATIPAETVSRARMATALGLIMGTGEIVGGFVMPTVAGVLSDAFGLGTAMVLSSVAAGVVVLLCVGLEETAPARAGRAGASRTRVTEAA